ELAAAIGVDVNAPDVKPLIPHGLEAGLAALRQRGHYPINHTVVIKDELIAKHGDLAADVFDAFARAKRHYVERLKAGRIEQPTEVDEVHRRALETAGEPLPYGIAPNRIVIEELIRHALTQGIITKPVTADELFAPSTRALVGGFRQAGFAPCPISLPPIGSRRRRASRWSPPPVPRSTR